MKDIHRAIGILLMLLWSLCLIYMAAASFSPTQISGALAEKFNEAASQAHATTMDKATTHTVEKELSTGRAISIVMAVAGFFAALAAYRGLPHWHWAIGVTSIAYLLVWIASGSAGPVSPVESIELRWKLAEMLDTKWSFLLWDAALPLSLVLATAGSILDGALKGRSR